MSILPKLVGQTAIYRLSSIVARCLCMCLLALLIGCNPNSVENLPGTWRIEAHDSVPTHYLRLSKGKWYTGRDSMELVFQGGYDIIEDSLIIRGELGGRTAVLVCWQNIDRVAIEYGDKTTELHRVKQ